MNLGFPEADRRVPNPKDLINLQQQQQNHFMMEGNGRAKDPASNIAFMPSNQMPSSYYTPHLHLQERKMLDYSSSLPLPLPQGTARRLLPAATYLGLLLCLAASLLILPLILPPLPPPPLMLLLLLPVGILAMLMVLAFMPSNETKHITTHTYL